MPSLLLIPLLFTCVAAVVFTAVADAPLVEAANAEGFVSCQVKATQPGRFQSPANFPCAHATTSIALSSNMINPTR